MEGLIPQVFRALKKNKTRRKYECLSSGNTAQNYGTAADLYTSKTDYAQQHAAAGHHHRRRNSHAGAFFSQKSVKDAASPSSSPKQLVRFRSHRMFTCVTGA